MKFDRRRREFSTHRTRLPVSASVALLLALSPSVCGASTRATPSPLPPSSPLSDLFGEQLTGSELTSIKGSVAWLLTTAEMDMVAALFAPLDTAPVPTGTSEVAADATAPEPDIDIKAMLALFEPATPPGGSRPNKLIQLAMLDNFPVTGILTDRLMQFQGAAAFDTSLRYLCAEKIYGDLYPNGTGWNNQAYNSCGPQGPTDPARDSDIRPLVFTRSDGPAAGEIATIIPCGGSLVNSASMTIQSQGNGPLISSFANPASMVLATASATSIRGGHHW